MEVFLGRGKGELLMGLSMVKSLRFLCVALVFTAEVRRLQAAVVYLISPGSLEK